MRRIIALLMSVSVCLASAAHAQTTQSSARRLNVLFIAVDDMNCDLPIYGEGSVVAPNLQRLAARGMRFDRAYCQFPLCSPSRTSLLAGLRPDTAGIYDLTTHPRANIGNAVLLPDLFQKNGYTTARVGKIFHGKFNDACKWNIDGSGDKADWDRAPATAPAATNPPGQGFAWKGPQWSARATTTSDEQEIDGRNARVAVRVMEQNKNKPFFVAVGFHRPHLPWVAPRKYFDLYPLEKIKLPSGEPANDRDDIPPIAISYKDSLRPMDERQWRQWLAAYYASITFMDAQLGVLLDSLDKNSLWDSTVVILWSDHGYLKGEHGGMQRKQALFEPVARVPMVLAAPGAKPGATERLVELVDIYPTLAELCGLTPPGNLEGTSVVPLLTDPKRRWKPAAFTQTIRPNKVMGRSVRTERYRFTQWGENGPTELYDHQTDPKEWTNLANDAEHAQTIAELKQLLNNGHKAALPPQSDQQPAS